MSRVKKQDKTNDINKIYAKYNSDSLKKSIIINANQMIDLNGKIDTFNLIDKFVIDNNPIMQYKDNKGNILNGDKNNDYWIKALRHFFRDLKRLNDEDISNISASELKDKSLSFNMALLNTYIGGIKINLVDLIDTQYSYAKHLASALVDLQAIEINKIGFEMFCNLDLTKHNKDFINYIQQDLLIKAQKQLDAIIDAKKLNKLDLDSLIKSILFNIQIIDSTEQVEKIIKDNQDYYNMLHSLYLEVDKLIGEIGNKYKQRDLELNTSNALIEIQDTIDNQQVAVKKSIVKIPQTYNIDFDIMKLFNNIYPNYKFKAIDDNRHKDLDIQAKLMLDLDVDTDDILINMQNMRLINFIKSGNIALYPIQSALINGFISIRDNQDTIDKVVPLLSTLKYITENNKLRLPKSKKDLQLYEDFMLFFDRCKMQVKIVDRASKKVVFEIMQPISILSNTPAYNGTDYGYVIGNSIINLLKNELDNIYTTPHQTSIKAHKGYLLSKLPNTPPTINLTQYIYGKVAQMINSYQRIAKYNGKVNIVPLYDFQALYNKHPKPTKDDKDKVRDMLNEYLDSLISKGLIISYTAIKSGKEINQYKIEINKDASL